MNTINVTKRDLTVKAKKLRRKTVKKDLES